ncbi:hypothetical protein OBV_12790 [Oscillibacter valericigenes Sjm18-20]|nr:hypothetical protein OBV_12790 [Oscillibacter valericigenes Sjm18-20]
MMKNHILSMILWCVSAIALGAATILIPSVSNLSRNFLGIATVVAICGLSVEFDRGHEPANADSTEGNTAKAYFSSLHKAA